MAEDMLVSKVVPMSSSQLVGFPSGQTHLLFSGYIFSLLTTMQPFGGGPSEWCLHFLVPLCLEGCDVCHGLFHIPTSHHCTMASQVFVLLDF